MNKQNERENEGREGIIKAAKRKIQIMRNKGLLTERGKNMLERAIMVSDDKLLRIAVELMANMTSVIKSEEEAEKAPKISRIVADAIRAQVLSGRVYKDSSNISPQEILKTLELYLEAMTNKATHSLSIVLGPITFNILRNFYENEESPVMSALSVMIKSIYVPNNPIPADGVIEFLFELQERYGIPYFEGPEMIGRFIESLKGSFVLIADNNYKPEINELVIEAISEGSVILDYSHHEFSGEEAHALNCAVEISSITENSMVMLYNDQPIIKPGIDLVSHQLDQCNKSVKVSITLVPLGVFPSCFE